jgi:formylglycine-generating enzyme required for sulfatase activity/energy-coupling factor transporter ATP-binding protein EcfA2
MNPSRETPEEIQAQIEELQQELSTMEKAGSSEIVLQAVRDKIADLKAQQQTSQKGEGKRSPEPGLAALGDRSVIVGGSAEGLIVITGDGNQVTISPEDVPVDILLKAYYRSLARECRQLPLGVIDLEFVHTTREGNVPLPDVYVDLDVTTPPRPEEEEGRREWAFRLEKGEGDDRTALLEAITQQNNRRAVLLGEAGSGKTTFVNYMTYLMSTESERLPEELQGLLPVRLILRRVAGQDLSRGTNGGAQILWDALQSDIAQRLGELAAPILTSALQRRLMEEEGFLFLDGLDEVPTAGERRQKLLDAVQDLAEQLPRAHILVTARPYAYAEKPWRLEAFPILALAPFHQEQVEGFVQRWYQAVRENMNWTEPAAQDKANRLQSALQQRPYLADLASRPLLLTLMTTLHSSWGQLPEDRADLYEETVKLLLTRWQRAREVRTLSGELLREPSIAEVLEVGEKTLRNILEKLAYTVHQRQREDPEGGRAGAADISEGELLVAFKPLLEQKKVGPDSLIQYLQNRAGLLISRQEGVYAFPHRSFQEYLTACFLADQADFADRLEGLLHQDPLWWREVFLLGVGKAKQGGLGQALSLVNYLLPAPEDLEEITEAHWRIASLAGQALLELRVREEIETTKAYEPLEKCARRWLVRLLEEGQLLARERAEAGDVLGELGDPRFDPEHWYLPDEPLLGFVKIPEGPFLMGSDPEHDQDAYEDEQPQHEVTFPSYYIARYPVTVAQFQAFVEYSDYEGFDRDALRDPANRPVRWLNWYDARAYTEWLQEQLVTVGDEKIGRGDLSLEERTFWQGLRAGTLRVGLPSEAEWEKAARGGAGLVYPWGDRPDPERANYAETGIGTTSAAGCFPNGTSPYDLLDMSGNVWEWTRSLWGEDRSEPEYGYPYSFEDGREDLEVGRNVRRVLRGGAFYDHATFVRCAYRSGLPPSFRDDVIGFRVVVSPSL